MNSFIETLNQWGVNFLGFAWPMLWQSSLLIAALLALDFLFRRKLRASIRYALWLVVLVKLCVPPTLALPTSPAWWIHKTPTSVAAKPKLPHYTVTYDQGPLMELPSMPLAEYTPPPPVMTKAAWLLAISFAVSSVLFFWLLVRWWQVAWLVCRAAATEEFSEALDDALRLVGTPSTVSARLQNGKQRAELVPGVPAVRLKIVDGQMSPAVCGLLRPTILIPKALAENFSDVQLRAILLHELIHLHRRDVWLNFFQTLLQIVYWWHPLVWLANARIRRVREEAVDDAVMLALRDEAETYAPTLLEVAKLALNRPLATLGLVGILESRSALRQRIERLVDFRPPRKAGLTLVSLLGILAFTAVAVPMGEAPVPAEKPSALDTGAAKSLSKMVVTFKLIHPISSEVLKQKLLVAGVNVPPTLCLYLDNGILLVRGSAEQLTRVNRLFLKLNGFSDQEAEGAANQFSGRTGLNGGKDFGTNLLSRIYKVDALAFAAASKNISDFSTNNVTAMASSLFSRLGVDMKSPKGKAVYYNDRLGKLFVKALVSDHDVIESIISALNEGVSSQTNAFALATVLTNAAISVRATSPSNLLTDTNFRMVIHALEQRSGTEKLAEPEVTTTSGRGRNRMTSLTISMPVSNLDAAKPTVGTTNSAVLQIHIKARFVEVPKEFLGKTGMFSSLTNSPSGGFTGILNSTNAQFMLKTLQARKDVKWLAEPEVTTTSGRQTQMRATRTISIITNSVFEENATNGDNTISIKTVPLETGPVFDVVPTVLADGCTLDLAITAFHTEFWGYAQVPSNAVPQTATNSVGETVVLPTFWPVMESRQESAHVALFDEQTAVLSLNRPEQVRFAAPDAKREEVVANWIQDGKKKNHVDGNEILVLVNATIVDPAGNRVHTDDELPFAKKGVPPQPPQAVPGFYDDANPNGGGPTTTQ